MRNGSSRLLALISAWLVAFNVVWPAASAPASISASPCPRCCAAQPAVQNPALPPPPCCARPGGNSAPVSPATPVSASPKEWRALATPAVSALVSLPFSLLPFARSVPAAAVTSLPLFRRDCAILL